MEIQRNRVDLFVANVLMKIWLVWEYREDASKEKKVILKKGKFDLFEK